LKPVVTLMTPPVTNSLFMRRSSQLVGSRSYEVSVYHAD
jgi:hypothetical protein